MMDGAVGSSARVRKGVVLLLTLGAGMMSEVCESRASMIEAEQFIPSPSLPVLDIRQPHGDATGVTITSGPG